MPYTSSQPAILECDIPIAEEDTTLEQTAPTKTHVSPSSDLRPFPRVSQNPTLMLPRKKKRSCRSRVLTDTEKDQIEAEHNKKVEKESQRLKRCLLKEI